MSPSLSLLLLGATALFSTFVQGDTCSDVEKKLPGVLVSRAAGKDYVASQQVYWNKAAGEQKATCLIYPKTTEDVSTIIKILNTNSEHFAVKGGGHMPNKEFNGINGGPLIALERMTQLQYNAETEKIQVGPGNRWHDVAGYMEKYGRIVVSGRIGHVGVPGLLLGGGLSFMSTQYGWASTHISEYEIVLANGTVTTATKDKNADLHRALQASGGIMGVVTRFTLNTFPLGQIWGGQRFYSAAQTPKMLAAIRDFTEHYPDPRAAIIATSETTLYGALGLWVVFFFYNGPVVPQNVFANFSKISHISSNTKTQSFSSFVYDNNKFSLNGSYYAIATETTPLPLGENGTEVMTGIYDYWKTTSSAVTNKLFGSISSIAFQPIPKMISEMTQKYGGNIMDLGSDGHRIIMEYNYSWLNGLAENELIVDATVKKLVGGTRQMVQKYIQQKKVPDIGTPLFANDAYHSQDYWGRFKERDFVKKVKDSVDPNGFFTARTVNWAL